MPDNTEILDRRVSDRGVSPCAKGLSRDPFAMPGRPGNRWIQYGSDGHIPAKYCPKVDDAINLAYDLNNKPQFAKIFRSTISKL